MNTNANTAADLFELFGSPIHTYTRAQAIEDGVLIELSYYESDTASVCRQHYKHPIACTAAVFEIMQKAVENPRYCNDYAGILHDMLFMSKAMARKLDESTVIFRCIIMGAGRSKYHDFKLQVGPGDQGEPVITIMLPRED
ncbi:DUF6573 family protein [Dechloromonas hortensis]|uniref:DUF6573 family protein n=1 Tax=Dechloromonas hortensis TaxID=337779 RepID=UPI00129138CD|nr:DUF6573 family protein [Dechloromonas hortensis]